MKKMITVLLSSLLLQANAQNTTATTYTLQQCVEAALNNNLDVRRAGYQMDAAKVNTELAKGNQLPFVNANIIHGINQGRSIDPYTNTYIDQQNSYANYNMGASLYLWNGASIQNNIRANNLSYEAGKMDYQQSKDNTTIYVILAYLQVLNNEEQLGAAEKQADITRQQAERLEVLNKDGAIAPATLYDMKGQLANDELSVVNLKSNLETAKLSLVQLMNIPYSPDLHLAALDQQLIPVYYEGTVEEIYLTAAQQLALVKAADLRQQSAEKQVKAAKGQLLPTISLNGGLGTNYSSAAAIENLISSSDIATNNYVVANGNKLPVYTPQGVYSSEKIGYGSQWKNNLNSYVSVAVQIPILNGFSARSKVRQAEITQKRTSFEAQTTKTQLRQSIEQAYVNMRTAYERYQKLDTQVKEFSASFRAAEIKFNAGVINSIDYLIVKNNLDRANINLIAARYDYVLRTKVLDYYQAKPLW